MLTKPHEKVAQYNEHSVSVNTCSIHVEVRELGDAMTEFGSVPDLVLQMQYYFTSLQSAPLASSKIS